MLIGVTLLASAFIAASLWLWTRRRLTLRGWLGAFVLVAWVVGVGVKVHLDRGRESRVETRVAGLPSVAWPASALTSSGEGAGRTAASAAGAASQPTTQAGPVSSLIGGLEQRLAANPGDAAPGWVLLAQSYAFTGDATAADGALRRAVALGVDEQELRARIADALGGAGSR